LLLDIRMPQMNGFELYRKIRDVDPQVRVCFLTALEVYYDEFRRVFPKLHLRCFARKPITPVELKKIIATEL
jgi:two-component SAPR family response regulator